MNSIIMNALKVLKSVFKAVFFEFTLGRFLKPSLSWFSFFNRWPAIGVKMATLKKPFLRGGTTFPRNDLILMHRMRLIETYEPINLYLIRN